MRPSLFRALLGIIAAPLHEPPPPPTPEEFARNLLGVVGRQSADHRRALADAFGANMAANLAEAYHPHRSDR
jgi:hypothetical protein